MRTLTGASPQYWTSLYRARLAGRALVEGKMPISEIAFASGFADQAHLTREMNRWFGVTPAALREDGAINEGLFSDPDAFS